MALFVSQEITQFFVNSGKMVVVDRSDIEKIRKELTFQLSGDVSDESAQSIGKMLGAQIIITSTLDDMRILRVKAIAVETARILGMERVHIGEGRLYTALASDTRDNKVVEVSTADELIAAIASDRVIRIRKGRYDISSSSHIKNRQVRWVDEFDGPTPVITGVSNIAFVGEEGVEIVIKPAYGWVFSFENCSGISLSG
ncbi:MAG TPA: CsgG/HfaB family protein, partial [Treponemataceae bacterium]|nr:CsgG/HfaB family protein [Treponemataceae bacterium]